MSGFLKKMKGFFGMGEKEEGREGGAGFKVQKQVHVESERRQPVVQLAGYSASGGVQGLDWYANRLQVDEDGDVADEFWEEGAGSGDGGLHVLEAAPAKGRAVMGVQGGDVRIGRRR